jgi:hypothetical protein
MCGLQPAPRGYSGLDRVADNSQLHNYGELSQVYLYLPNMTLPLCREGSPRKAQRMH